ncbi:MAG TPA: LacI family transcriptional regulator [Lactobacillus sp.]|nr:LacI family transcriptional regulator [Lactobacillus sp.]
MTDENKKNSIDKVASAAGVSIATVSRFLNGQLDRMSEKTAKRIQNIIDEMNYVPNAAARQLMTKTSKMIAVVVANIEDYFSSEIFKGIDGIAITEGYTPVLFDTNGDEQQELYLIDKINQQNFDALIIQPLNVDANMIKKHLKRNIPVITVDRLLENSEWPTVVSDNYDVTKNVSNYYLSKGYTHAVIVTEPIGTVSTRRDRAAAIKSVYPDASLVEVNAKDNVAKKVKARIFADVDKKEKILIFALKERLVLKLAARFRQDFTNANIKLTGFAESDVLFEINPGLKLVRQNPFKMGVTTGELILSLLNSDEASVPAVTVVKADYL